MLPRLDVNAGRGASRRDILQSRSGAEQPHSDKLPRLRLLKQVGDESPVAHLPPAYPPPHPSLPSAAPVRRGGFAAAEEEYRDARQPRLPRSRGDSNERRPGSGGHRRGRGLLRPLEHGAEAKYEPRAPPVLPAANRDPSIEVYEETDPASLLLQQRARERVKEQRRQQRRAAREEQERKQQAEQERLDRAERAQVPIEAHRRDLGRQAAERARRFREDREDKAAEREELQSARRERMRRYQTPSQIRELRRSDQQHHSNRLSSSVGSGSEAAGCQADDVHSVENVCSCGNVFMPDSVFCRKCGEKRLAAPKESSSPGRAGQRRTGRPQHSEVHGSRDRDRRRRNGGRSRGGAREQRTSRGQPQGQHECAAEASPQPKGSTQAPDVVVDLTEDSQVQFTGAAADITVEGPPAEAEVAAAPTTVAAEAEVAAAVAEAEAEVASDKSNCPDQQLQHESETAAGAADLQDQGTEKEAEAGKELGEVEEGAVLGAAVKEAGKAAEEVSTTAAETPGAAADARSFAVSNARIDVGATEAEEAGADTEAVIAAAESQPETEVDSAEEKAEDQQAKAETSAAEQQPDTAAAKDDEIQELRRKAGHALLAASSLIDVRGDTLPPMVEELKRLEELASDPVNEQAQQPVSNAAESADS